ncbi:hypothetical protein EJ06DRAFT_3092 [Trichodelitschia bisporula]|uniref:Uncharacterized protein n=1 Tax=Trichodelitschia bisporula TaxID=703511 RepID=A0A6G1I9W5_9PEZI|nr:hypothetical protein EJ06DRAFT_3092 [Trichodelitschia bisporula]
MAYPYDYNAYYTNYPHPYAVAPIPVGDYSYNQHQQPYPPPLDGPTSYTPRSFTPRSFNTSHTSYASSPPSSSTSSSHRPPPHHRRRKLPRHRSYPPPPCVEDEAHSLAREHPPRTSSSDDVVMRGYIDQDPILIELPVDPASAVRHPKRRPTISRQKPSLNLNVDAEAPRLGARHPSPYTYTPSGPLTPRSNTPLASYKPSPIGSYKASPIGSLKSSSLRRHMRSGSSAHAPAPSDSTEARPHHRRRPDPSDSSDLTSDPEPHHTRRSEPSDSSDPEPRRRRPRHSFSSPAGAFAVQPPRPDLPPPSLPVPIRKSHHAHGYSDSPPPSPRGLPRGSYAASPFPQSPYLPQSSLPTSPLPGSPLAASPFGPHSPVGEPDAPSRTSRGFRPPSRLGRSVTADSGLPYPLTDLMPSETAFAKPRRQVARSGSERSGLSSSESMKASERSGLSSTPSSRGKRTEAETSRALTRVSPPPDAPINLPPCPRSHASRAQDWFAPLSAPDFAVCPSCYAGVFATGPMGAGFVPVTRGGKTVCSFSGVWARLGWLLTLRRGGRDLSLVTSGTGGCQGGGEYGLKGCPAFVVCARDRRRLAGLFACLEGRWVRREGGCVLGRGGGGVFARCLDALVQVDEAASLSGDVDLTPLRAVVPGVASDEEEGRFWADSSLPEFLVCTACWTDNGADAQRRGADAAVGFRARTVHGGRCAVCEKGWGRVWTRALGHGGWGYLVGRVREREAENAVARVEKGEKGRREERERERMEREMERFERQREREGRAEERARRRART